MYREIIAGPSHKGKFNFYRTKPVFWVLTALSLNLYRLKMNSPYVATLVLLMRSRLYMMAKLNFAPTPSMMDENGVNTICLLLLKNIL
jgi:hypothetical protein